MKEKITLPYNALKQYIRFLNNYLFLGSYFALDTDNIPPEGEGTLIVSDHQNSLNDALGILLSMEDRKVHFITRADVFKIHPLASRFLYWIGLLPAYRLSHEGAEALSDNDATFKVTEQNLLDGRTVVIYPEAGHQDKHWLGTFTYGYTRLAFGAAELGGFEKDIKILPSCNHWSAYRGVGNDMLVRYGTPISLAPYYELYKTKPRTAQREVNRLVREQIKSMMLSIDDLDHYAQIDWLRSSAFGDEYARGLGLDPSVLPQKLQADRSLVASLEGKDAPWEDVSALTSGMEKLGFGEAQMQRRPSISSIVLCALLAVVFLPLAVFALWPSALSWFIPRSLARKMKDPMLESSFVVGLNVLFIIPIAAIITLIFGWIASGFIRALAWALLLPFLCVFEWHYYDEIRKLISDIKYYNASKAGLARPLEELRSGIFEAFGKIVKTTENE